MTALPSFITSSTGERSRASRDASVGDRRSPRDGSEASISFSGSGPGRPRSSGSGPDQPQSFRDRGARFSSPDAQGIAAQVSNSGGRQSRIEACCSPDLLPEADQLTDGGDAIRRPFLSDRFFGVPMRVAAELNRRSIRMAETRRSRVMTGAN